jgi:hypothetical protein
MATIFYSVRLDLEGFPVQYELPGDPRPRWFAGPFGDPGDASQEFKAAYASYGYDCEYVDQLPCQQQPAHYTPVREMK